MKWRQCENVVFHTNVVEGIEKSHDQCKVCQERKRAEEDSLSTCNALLASRLKQECARIIRYENAPLDQTLDPLIAVDVRECMERAISRIHLAIDEACR